MKLIRLVVSLAVLAGVVYFSITVPLGNKTLWEHIKAIAGSQESKELVDGVKDGADKVIDHSKAEPQDKPADKLTPKERRLLRKLIRDKLNEGEDAKPTKPEAEGG